MVNSRLVASPAWPPPTMATATDSIWAGATRLFLAGVAWLLDCCCHDTCAALRCLAGRGVGSRRRWEHDWLVLGRREVTAAGRTSDSRPGWPNYGSQHWSRSRPGDLRGACTSAASPWTAHTCAKRCQRPLCGGAAPMVRSWARFRTGDPHHQPPTSPRPAERSACGTLTLFTLAGAAPCLTPSTPALSIAPAGRRSQSGVHGPADSSRFWPTEHCTLYLPTSSCG